MDKKNTGKREIDRCMVLGYIGLRGYIVIQFVTKFPHNIRNGNFVTLKVISISTVCIIAICHLKFVTVKSLFQISLFH